jgi:hypothetical protein
VLQGVDVVIIDALGFVVPSLAQAGLLEEALLLLKRVVEL